MAEWRCELRGDFWCRHWGLVGSTLAGEEGSSPRRAAAGRTAIGPQFAVDGALTAKTVTFAWLTCTRMVVLIDGPVLLGTLFLLPSFTSLDLRRLFLAMATAGQASD